jgi:hypothetical protein
MSCGSEQAGVGSSHPAAATPTAPAIAARHSAGPPAKTTIVGPAFAWQPVNRPVDMLALARRWSRTRLTSASVLGRRSCQARSVLAAASLSMPGCVVHGFAVIACRERR